MSNIYINIDNSKIMIAAAFVQYVIYSVFYLIFRNYNPPEDANSSTSPVFDQDSQIEKSFRHKQPNKLEIPDDAQAHQQASEEAEGEVKANEISVEMGAAGQHPSSISKQGTSSGTGAHRNDREQEEDKPTAHEILDRFPKILHYYFASIILCASMSPTMFAVVIAWSAVGFRLAQMMCAMFRKMALVVIFYSFGVACTIFLFCNAMFHS